MSHAVERSQDNSTGNAPMSFLRRLSAKLKAEKVQHRSRSSSNAEPCGAAVPYQDPTTADDCDDDDDVIAGRQPIGGGGNSSGSKVCIDGDNNEVFEVASADVVRTPLSCHCFDLSFPDSPGLLSAGIRSPGQFSPDICSPENEILSAAALLRRAQSVAFTTNGHFSDGHLSVNGCCRHAGDGDALSPYRRSMSVTQSQGHASLCLRGPAVFDIRREVLGSLAESGDAERLRIALKSDNEAVNASDEAGLTALHKAAIRGHSHAVRILLLYGADVELKTEKGQNALTLAVEYGHPGVVSIITDYMQSFNKRPQDPCVVLRARQPPTTATEGFAVYQVKSCAELKSFRRQHIDYIHLLVCQGQKLNELAIFLYSVLDVPVGHAFFINGVGTELNMNNFQRFDDDHHLLNESITVRNTRLRSMQAVKFRQLRSLVLVDCNLSELVLDSLECLETLDVRRNRLTSLPRSIGRCRRLRTLRVASNELRQLPGNELGGLRRLVAFDCSFNRLKRLSTHIVQCIELTSLAGELKLVFYKGVITCNDNGLIELPVDIGLLVCLEELRTHNNRLSQLPVSISALTRLRRISFSGNPLTNIPVDFPERAKDVRQYLQSLQEDPVPNNIVKLVVVGQEGVGKTCLLKAIKRTSWILPQGDIPATEGIEIRDVKLNDVTLRCFDCCGNIDFNETHNFFITRGAIYLVCFNLAEYCIASVERESFLLGRLQLWLQYIFTKVPDARVLVVGTHADHPGLTRSILEEIWDHLRRMLVDARDHHRRYFSPCSTPVYEAAPGVDDGRCHSNGIDTADACCADEHSSSAGIRHTVVAERLADCLLCQQDSRCYRRSASTTGVSGGFVNLGFTPNLPSPGSNRPILAERSISTIEEETSFCTSETRSVTFPHIVGYYEVSSVRHLGSVGPGSSNGGVASRGIEHLKVAICELANKLIRENPEAPRSWARVAEALRARRLRDSIDGDDGEGISGVVNGGPMSTVDEVAAIAAVQGITDKRELNSMLQFFKAQGILLYFPQLADLDELVILDPVWLARIFAAVLSSRDLIASDDRGFVARDRLRAAWQTIINEEDQDKGHRELRDRRILTLFRHFGLCVPVEGTDYELFPNRLPLSDIELDPQVWRPLPDPKKDRQVTYSATFPSIIPPPFFNCLIAAFYSYRSDSPPTSPRSTPPPIISMCGSGTSSLVDVDRCPQYACYFADKLVDWLRVDRPGCRDCRRPSASGLRNDSGDDLKCDGDNRSLYHRVLIELIAHRRTIQVTARGAMPCCAVKKVCHIFDQVVKQFDGLGSIQLDSVVCPGCFTASQVSCGCGPDGATGRRLHMHKYSALALVTSLERVSPSSSSVGVINDRLLCSNGHVISSARELLCGIIGDWFAQHTSDGSLTSSKARDHYNLQLTVPVTTDCPHLFILLPVNRDGLSFDSDQRLYASTLVPDGYAVHLLCEFPDGYHVTYEPGYRLRNPRDFVRRYGGHVVSTLRLLVKLANSTVVSAECAARSRAVAKTADALIKDLTTRFPTLKTIIARENADERTSRDETLANQRVVKRDELRRYLHLADHRPDVFGPLRRFRCRTAAGTSDSSDGHVAVHERMLWLCDDHVRQMRDAESLTRMAAPSSTPALTDVQC